MGSLNEDKFLLPVSRKDLLPRGKRDRSLFILMLVMVPSVFIFDVFYVLPAISHNVTFHLPFGIYILINISVNMLQMLRLQPSARELPPGVLPSVLMPNWFYCHECQLNVPPRSYHCRVCDECILKHDHHCNFAGRCVGFGNHRFFLVGLVYILVGTAYSLVLHFNFTVTHFLGGYRWQLFLWQLAPHLGWLFGAFDMYGCLVAMLNLFEFFVVLLCATLLFGQVGCVVNNQTMYERKHGVTKFRHPTLIENLEEVFGDRYLLVWLWPFVKSEPRGDGINFFNYEGVEDRKSL